ncbi:MAG: DUF2851 family protein [Planctomycetota bacterium]
MGYPKSANVLASFPRAGQYRRLRERVLGIPGLHNILKCADKKQEPELEKITEKFLYYLWAEQPIKGLAYRTGDNREVRIDSSGLWNSSPGPDFTDAAISIAGQICKGDIEMHLYSSDWYRHKHHLDRRYNNLVLHIALWDDEQKPIRLNNKKEVPQVVLAPMLRGQLEDIDKLLELDVAVKQGQYYTSAGRCYSLASKAPSEKTASFLEGAGESRMLRKMENLAGRLERFNGDYEEVLYQGIMGALGYRNNQLPFLQLAETVPYRKIREMLKDYPAEKHALVIQSVLLRQAGFIPDAINGFDLETRYYLKSLPVIKGLNSACGEWTSGGRPANSPYRRIAGISYLLSAIPSLFGRVLDINKELFWLFCIPPTGYWSRRSSFAGKLFRNEQALIGKERAEAIVLNIVIPLVFLYARAGKDNKLQDSVLGLYRSYPRQMENYYTRFMKQRLFKSDAKLYSGAVKTASAQQGLIEIFTDFCKKGYEGCERCGLREYLKG